MNTQRRRRPDTTSGFTMIEMLMTVVVGSILFLAVTRVLSSGLRISQKGSSHLTNTQSAASLLSQLEKDLTQADKVTLSAGGGIPANIELLEDLGEKGTFARAAITWDLLPKAHGIRRTQTGTSEGSPQSYVFCPGLTVECSLTPVEVGTAKRKGWFVVIRVINPMTTANGSGEEALLRRFIYGWNLPENRATITDGTW